MKSHVRKKHGAKSTSYTQWNHRDNTEIKHYIFGPLWIPMHLIQFLLKKHLVFGIPRVWDLPYITDCTEVEFWTVCSLKKIL